MPCSLASSPRFQNPESTLPVQLRILIKTRQFFIKTRHEMNRNDWWSCPDLVDYPCHLDLYADSRVVNSMLLISHKKGMKSAQ